MVSLLLPALMVSLPPRPQITSAPLVPFNVSLPDVPVIVQPRLLLTVVFSASVLFAVPDAARLPSEQVTVELAVEHDPWLVDDDTIDDDAPERVVATLTPVAPAVPVLATAA